MWTKVIGRKTYTSAALKASVSLNGHLLEAASGGAEVATSNAPRPAATVPSDPRRIIPIVDYNKQTLEICKFERIRRSTVVGAEPLWKYMFSDARTLVECFQRGARLSDNGPCLGYRGGQDGAGPYEWLSYDDVLNRSESFARGLIAKGLKPGQSSLIGIYSRNRPEFVIAEQGCYMFSMIVVPLYDTLGPEACSFIINQAEIQVIVCDSDRRVEILLQKASCCRYLRFVVVMDEPSDNVKRMADDAGIELLTMSAVEQLGAAARSQMPPMFPQFPSPDDLATICYTSGTTGNVKGAMITHGNIVAATTSAHMLRFSRLRCGDVMLSFLPMAHMYERLLQAIFFATGGCVGFSRGDVKLLADDIETLRPHVIPSVPRLLNRLYDKVMLEVGESSMKRWLLNLAVRAKTAQLQNLIVRNDTLWDDVVFRKLQRNLGGRLKLLLSGSAPISRDVLHMLRAGIGALVVEGYGATETCASGCSTAEGDFLLDHVGIPSPCCEIKLADVFEMNLFAKNGRGEVCIRGNNVFQGYYKDSKNTAKLLDKDGWFRTGDIGEWTSRGTLKLTDRKKNIFKLDQGEYILPERIENVYNRTQYVCQSYIHGDSMRSYLVAVVVVDPEVLPKAAERRFGLKAPLEELCQNEKIIQMVHDDMILEGYKAGLQSFEQAKRILLDCSQFTVDNGLLTPTLKSKRFSLREYYKNEISFMYDEMMPQVRLTTTR